MNVDEIASEIRTIYPSLSEAIAHDVAHGGDAEVAQIDAANGNTDAADAARLVLVASLSTTPGAIHGLREYQLVDCLQRPGRDLSTFKAKVLDQLATRAWYLHNSADGRLFFKNQQNLAAKLRSTALSLHSETVDRMLREHLIGKDGKPGYFTPFIRDCYQAVYAFPPPDEIRVEQEKTTLVIVRPGGQANQLPISSDWQAWWAQQQYKNRVIFLTGSRDTFQKVLDSARQTRALESIEDDLKAKCIRRGHWREEGNHVRRGPFPPPSPEVSIRELSVEEDGNGHTYLNDANRRLRANGLPTHKFQKNPAKPVPVHPSLGKELCILCWAVEDASPDDIPNALRNWDALAPEERWWLFTMTVATTGQAMQKGIGWRKALRAALADNPFVKGEGLSPKARRELLGHSQLSLGL